ncbi:hypothetical protein GZH47_32625 (plasmid) [Paenibacillus rhizovicinus]|uniref:Uncharacterized protein n=1 Tax=Paenibacillus rhizovicinus TaxID=2704463 RepID=A0A6C0PBB4_9BACL|nr:hypothetical protein [Paenibacillus rhizovicinus]QHW35645.1 hypothetical protein GZH47_32625 [Paenibacillus rhizovicinus]
MRYLIVEADSLASGEAATITEIQVIDNLGQVVSYTPKELFGAGDNMYWTDASVWGPNHLNDGNLTYTNNTSGSTSSTIMLYKAAANGWARFALDLKKDVAVKEINVWAGSPEGRIPVAIRIYGASAYTVASNLNARSNSGLTLLGTLPFTSSNRTVQKYTISVEPNPFLLLQSGASLYSLVGDVWTVVGQAPATENLFKTYGLPSLDAVTVDQWANIPANSKALLYTTTGNSFSATITTHNLYDSSSKMYHGTGILETEAEELPAGRTVLMVNAEHELCTFKYSLNDGVSWTPLNIGVMIDITGSQGNDLKIQITLPSDTAKLKAISYAWA